MNTCNLPGDVLGAKRKGLLRDLGGDDQKAVRHRDLELEGNAWPTKKCGFGSHLHINEAMGVDEATMGKRGLVWRMLSI